MIAVATVAAVVLTALTVRMIFAIDTVKMMSSVTAAVTRTRSTSRSREPVKMMSSVLLEAELVAEVVGTDKCH
ncbi:MAG TPA: hypothetical protein VEL11_11545 [Candidatus Bathyarchaeia archaeon]|nr:hypothetical protein [Candidatus Bathyarchaeia archaeon]